MFTIMLCSLSLSLSLDFTCYLFFVLWKPHQVSMEFRERAISFCCSSLLNEPMVPFLSLSSTEKLWYCHYFHFRSEDFMVVLDSYFSSLMWDERQTIKKEVDSEKKRCIILSLLSILFSNFFFSPLIFFSWVPVDSIARCLNEFCKTILHSFCLSFAAVLFQWRTFSFILLLWFIINFFSLHLLHRP